MSTIPFAYSSTFTLVKKLAVGDIILAVRYYNEKGQNYSNFIHFSPGGKFLTNAIEKNKSYGFRIKRLITKRSEHSLMYLSHEN